MVAVAAVMGPAFAMQKGNGIPVGLAAMRRTGRCMVRCMLFLAIGLQGATLTTTAASAARTF
jgi:hypothetical protein